MFVNFDFRRLRQLGFVPDPVKKIGVFASPDCGIGVADRGFSDLILL